MARSVIVAGCVGCLTWAACVLSVDAVVPDSAGTSDPRLVGEWRLDENGSRERARITQDGNTYDVDYTDQDGHHGTFSARLGHLGGRLVLDAWPKPASGRPSKPTAYADLPGHLLVAIDFVGDSLVARTLDPDSAQAALRAGGLRLVSTSSDDRVVLQGTTPQLRTGLARYLSRPGVWTEPSVWRRAVDLGGGNPVEPPCFEAAAWHEADELFHQDPRWVGSDVASTVDLGGGRTLWLFGDTWIDSAGTRARHGGAVRMVSNSVAIETGADPSRARMTFYWGHDRGRPAAFLPGRRGEQLWFGNGVRVGDRLVLFLERVVPTPDAPGFASAGWTAFLVDNPDSEPSAWRPQELATSPNPLGIDLGFAGVWRDSGYVYAFGTEDPVKSHPTYVARWLESAVHDGDLSRPEWWAGDRQWVPDSSTAPRWPVLENGSPEVTIHYDARSERYLEVQTVGFGAADIALRAAARLTGPWTAPRTIYRPSEYYRPNIMIYAAKAHPTLRGADLVMTYATNSFDGGEQASDTGLYYPRFVRLTRCR